MTTSGTAPANGQDMVLQPVFDFWQGFLGEGVKHSQQWCDGMKDALDPAALRRQWFDALAQTLDRTMRTPAFLEAMRRNFEAVTQLKSATEDYARDVSRATGIPRISDISGLFERLQIGQEAILTRLAAIEGRLETLENSKRKRHDS